MFIDQLETIEYKTKGNLSAQEAKLLQDALAQLRLAFVEASGGTPPSMMPDRGPAYDFPGDDAPLGDDAFEDEPPAAATPPAPAPAPAPASPSAPASAPDESKKKFSKSYG
jgi:hypothetical protein